MELSQYMWLLCGLLFEILVFSLSPTMELSQLWLLSESSIMSDSSQFSDTISGPPFQPSLQWQPITPLNMIALSIWSNIRQVQSQAQSLLYNCIQQHMGKL